MPSCLVSWHKKKPNRKKNKKLAQLKSFSSVSSCHKQRQVLLYLKPLKLAKLFAIDKFGLARPRVISSGFCQDPRTTQQQPGHVQLAKGDRKLKFIRRQFPITTRTQGVCVCVWCQILGKMFIKFVASKFACRRAKTTEWSTPGHQGGLQGHDT